MRCGLLGWLAVSLCIVAPALAADWPMLRQNLSRTGFTPDCPPPPYEPKWARADLADENILCWVEPIVADGRVYIGTGAGNVYALDRRDGKTLWKTDLGSPVMHSVAYHEGRIFTGVHGNWEGAFVAALDARTGEIVWKTRTPPGGFWTSPAVSDGLVILGSRDHRLYAFDEKNGELRWTIPTGGPILSSPAVRDGRVYFASEDMRLYCAPLKAANLIAGAQGPVMPVLWRTDVLDGRTFRGYSPVLWKDKVVLRSATTIVYAAYEVEGQLMYYEWAGWPRNYQGLVVQPDGKAINPAFRNEYEKAPDDEKQNYTYSAIAARKWAHYTPLRVRQENEAYREKLRQRPALRTAFLIDMADGVQRSVLPINYASGCAATPVPPAIGADETMYVIFKSFYSNWDVPIRAHDAIGRYNLQDQMVELIQFEPRDPRQNPMHTYFHITADETNHLTVAGHILWNQHGTNGSRGWYVGAMDLNTRQFVYGVGGEGVAYPKAFGLEVAPAAGSSGHVGGTVVSDNQIFNLVSGVLTCIGPRGDGPAMTAPVPPANRPVPVPPAVKLAPVTVEQVIAETMQRSQPSAQNMPLSQELSDRLRYELDTLVEGGPWRPLRITGGMCINPLLGGGDQFYFVLPSETLGAIARAFPYLGEELRQEAMEHTAMQWQRFRPWTNTVYEAHDESTRYNAGEDELMPRERYKLGHWLYGPYPQFHGIGGAMTSGQFSVIANYYPIWLYGHNMNQWARVEQAWPDMKKDMAAFIARRFVPRGEQTVMLNSYISGLIGYARIARHFNDADESRKASEELTRLLELRLEIERKTPLVGGKNMYQGHYDRMCPELWRYLVSHAAERMSQQMAPNLFGRPNEPKVISLFHAWGVGPHESRHHEAYVTPPSTVMAAFEAMAYLYGTPPRQLRDEYLDMPWVLADLYFMEKLALTLDLLANGQWRPAKL